MQNSELGNQETFDASSYSIGIVVADFNSDITLQLLASAQTELKKYKVPENNTAIIQVAGSIEIPVVLQALAKTKKYSCLVALGCVIRGETTHYDYVCKIVSEGVLRVMLDNNIAIGFGVLTVENKAQALERVESGAGAVRAALGAAKEIKKIPK